VHIFSFFIFSFVFIFAQKKLVYIKSLDDILIKDTLNLVLKNQSKLSLSYQLQSFNLDSNYTVYKPINKLKTIDSLFFNEDIDLDKNVIKQIFKPYMNTPIGYEFSIIGRQLMSRYYFITKEPEYSLGIINGDILGAMLKFNPHFESSFSGIFGMSRLNTSLDFIGELNLHLENFTNSAEKFDLFWQRTDTLSQIIKIGTFLPHPFNWNMGVDFKYHHELFSGLYTLMENRLMLHTFIPILKSFKIGFIRGRTIPTKSGINNGYEKLKFNAFSIVSSTDSRNDRLFPSNGSSIHSNVDGGLEGQMVYVKSQLELQSFYPISNYTNIKFKWIGKGIYYHNSFVPKSRYIWFGGTSTLRGYEEQTFLSTQYQIYSIELLYRPVLSLQTKFFVDLGTKYLNFFEKNMIGFGIGLNQINENSIIRLEYAISNTAISDGKIHIKWISRI